jgi:hypothetical protein
MEGNLDMKEMEIDVRIVLPPRWNVIMLMSGRFSSHVSATILIQDEMKRTDLVVVAQFVRNLEFEVNTRGGVNKWYNVLSRN